MDSLAVLDLARRVEPEVPVVFFESGLDYGETYDYLSKTTHTWRLDLHRIPTDPPLLQVPSQVRAVGSRGDQRRDDCGDSSSA